MTAQQNSEGDARQAARAQRRAAIAQPSAVMTARPPLALITSQSRTAGRNGFVFAKIMIVDCRPPSRKLDSNARKLDSGLKCPWECQCTLQFLSTSSWKNYGYVIAVTRTDSHNSHLAQLIVLNNEERYKVLC